LFQRYGVEDQLAAMYHPLVQLKSGGYIVINPTEALVSIDINSGRSTREHNIEQTAYATNIEAAQEIARQLRLRDMAGLVVIDFIDMEQNSHVRKVEKAMKEALKNDRARIQVGRISSFGLMEMSRQRLRTGVLEASTKACQHCEGTGLMRTASSAGLSALRMIEDEAARGRGDRVCLRAGAEAAIYVLNKKRAELADIEARYGVSVEVLVDPSFEGARMAVDSSGPRPVAPVRQLAPAPVYEDEPEVDEEELVEEFAEDEIEEREERGDSGESDEDRSRRRRRRRRGGRNRRRDGEPGEGEAGEAQRAEGSDQDEDEDEDQLQQPVEADAEGGEAPAKDDEAGSEDERRKRRGRRGGRRRGGRGRDREEAGREEGGEELTPEPGEAPMVEPVPSEDPAPQVVEAQPEPQPEPEPVAEEKPKARRRPRARKTDAVATEQAAPAPVVEEAAVEAAIEEAPAAEEKPKPKRRSRAKKAEAPVETAPEPQPEPELELVGADAGEQPEARASEQQAGEDAGQSTRKGWWSRTFG
jgi:ribonuclease E